MSAALLMRSRGFEGTSFSEVIGASGAPRGSIYHYFPEGKTQLIEEATRFGGTYIADALAAAFESGGPHAALDMIEEFWRTVLGESDFAEGCPIVAATVAGESAPAVRDAAGRVFKGWSELVAEGFVRHGMELERARRLGSFVFSAVEGAVVLARAQRSFEPLDAAIAELRRIVDDAFPA